jgi:AAA+ ATPase superfamily predicted ATPase
MKTRSPDNPFAFGALALDRMFANRERELAELTRDMRNGQDVVLVAPRRYGKSSLVLRAIQEVSGEGVLVAYCDLMRTPTKERFAAALASTILENLDTPVGQLLDRAAALFRGLRLRPVIEVDPDDASLSFSFQASRRPEDVDDTIETLLELPGSIGAERRRRVVVVFDEFQEVVKLDAAFPNLMRAVFQTQPEVGHVYLGSKRHVLESIFSDRNEPFWRSARRMDVEPIPEPEFAEFVRARFGETGRDLEQGAAAHLLSITHGHPYATQELAYFTWELAGGDGTVTADHVEAALETVLRSEHNNLARIWELATRNERLVLLALAKEPLSLYAEQTRARFGLPAATFVQRAVRALVQEDVVEKDADGRYRIAEPFLADWIVRQQSGGVAAARRSEP